jgi:FkbM family methyltransferase
MASLLPRIYRAAQLGLLFSDSAKTYGVRLCGPRFDATYHMIVRENYGDFVMESLRAADPSLTFLDIGANIGLFSCALYTHFEGKVHCFEPNPETFYYLQQNLMINGAENARAWCAGVYDSEDVSATLNRAAHRSGAASMVNQYDASGTRISLLRPHDLSNIVQPKARFCIKVDVEGVEKNVILALKASGLLERTDRIVIEMSENTSDTATLNQIRDLLKLAGLSLTDRKGSDVHADELYIRE